MAENVAYNVGSTEVESSFSYRPELMDIVGAIRRHVAFLIVLAFVEMVKHIYCRWEVVGVPSRISYVIFVPACSGWSLFSRHMYRLCKQTKYVGKVIRLKVLVYGESKKDSITTREIRDSGVTNLRA